MDNNELYKLLDISIELSQTRLLDPLLRHTISLAIDLVNAERGYLVLTSENSLFDFQVKSDREGNELKDPDGGISHAILSKVIEEKRSWMIPDAALDPEFSQSEDVNSLRLLSILCVPLVYNNEILGAIYFENRSDGSPFEEKDVDSLELFSRTVSIFIKNALLNDDLEARFTARTIELQHTNNQLYKEVTERKLYEEQLKNLSNTDSLTELHNRRHFYRLAVGEISRSKRYHHELSIIMIDIDHFKKINDVHGHTVGDQILKSIAIYCRNLFRENDILARYGGEEFVIILPETPLEQARNAAERLRVNIERAIFVTSAGELSIEVSVGVSSWSPRREIELDELINRADMALNQAKQAGRNRVSVWEEPNKRR